MPSAPSDNSAQIAHLEFRQKELAAKAERLAVLKSTPDHDIESAKKRNENQLAEIADELKRLGAGEGK